MTMGLLWALCDAIAAAVSAAKPTWTVEVVADPQRNLAAIKSGDAVELLIGPIESEEENTEGSRRGISGSLTVGIRMRSRIADGEITAATRAKCAKWDEAVVILQRRDGFLAGDFGKVYWTGGSATYDLMALRNDRVVSIFSSDLTFSSLHLKPIAT